MKEKKLELDDHNFRIDSTGWKKKKSMHPINIEYLENPTGDIWEILDGECKGEQLFTWYAAMRETKKAGRRIPTDKEFLWILWTNKLPNLFLVGRRNISGSFDFQNSANLWSSTESGADAWYRHFYSSYSFVYRGTHSKGLGFSVRCIKE